MTETGADDEILTQMDRLWDLGIRQIISIHEFDNAFGGNGIFDALVLNVGNRENTGGIPDLADITTLTDIGALTGVLAVPDGMSPLGNLPLLGEAATGEFWTTYDCPTVDDPSVGGGFFSGDRAGTVMTSLPPGCLFVGQGGRPGGALPCYPSTPQCNARWMTPMGLYTYRKLMERGWIIDVDHLEFEMKNQLLELAEAQPQTYPLVSTHGTFGGMSNAQAIRILQGGGYIYPSLSDGVSHLTLLDELKGLWNTAGQPFEFGFGFGTDTNGLSAQAPPRSRLRPATPSATRSTSSVSPTSPRCPSSNRCAACASSSPKSATPKAKAVPGDRTSTAMPTTACSPTPCKRCRSKANRSNCATSTAPPRCTCKPGSAPSPRATPSPPPARAPSRTDCCALRRCRTRRSSWTESWSVGPQRGRV